MGASAFTVHERVDCFKKMSVKARVSTTIAKKPYKRLPCTQTRARSDMSSHSALTQEDAGSCTGTHGHVRARARACTCVRVP
eukprot:6173105-Pleurochrysis_carterae.AAC.3